MFLTIFAGYDTGFAIATMNLHVDMPSDGGSSQYKDLTDLPNGCYTNRLTWGKEESVFRWTYCGYGCMLRISPTYRPCFVAVDGPLPESARNELPADGFARVAPPRPAMLLDRSAARHALRFFMFVIHGSHQ